MRARRWQQQHSEQSGKESSFQPSNTVENDWKTDLSGEQSRVPEGGSVLSPNLRLISPRIYPARRQSLGFVGTSLLPQVMWQLP